MMKNSKFLIVTRGVTLIYCCFCFISMGCILYGSDKVFQFGNYLIYLWMFNPIVLILSVVGFIRRKENKDKFIICATLSVISWFIAGMILAMSF